MPPGLPVVCQPSIPWPEVGAHLTRGQSPERSVPGPPPPRRPARESPGVSRSPSAPLAGAQGAVTPSRVIAAASFIPS
jgi:hypothetical protein